MKARIAIFIAGTVAVALAAYGAIALDSPGRWVVGAGGAALLLVIIWLARVIVMPLSRIIHGMDLLRAQDFASRLRPVGQRDADRLSATFNMMMDALHRERSRVLEQDHYLGLLVEASPMGLVNFDYDGRITDLNPAARRLLGLPARCKILGLGIADIPSPLAPGLAALRDGESATMRVDATIIGATLSHFIDRGARRPFLMLVRLDEEMRTAERRGYTTAIRTMAHEVNNTIGAVGSALQTIKSIVDGGTLDAGDRADADDLIQASSERLQSAGKFIGSFADLARLPKPVFATLDMGLLAERLEPLLRSAAGSAALAVKARAGAFIIQGDASQMEQVLVNLVKNASESIASSGRTDGHIDVRVDAGGLRVTDNGAGISPEHARAALADPFFTTKPGGQGIGLTLTADIVRAHRLRCSLATDPATGLTTFVLTR